MRSDPGQPLSVVDEPRGHPGRACAAAIRLRSPGASFRRVRSSAVGGGATLELMGLQEIDLVHLRRCVELAREALKEGDEPFGSLLVDASGSVRFEERNRVKDGDQTRHPEFEIARWTAVHLTSVQRAAATVYTSGEHCPMCSAAHGWMGLGRIVYAVSSAQLTNWRTEWDATQSPVAPLPVSAVAPDVPVDGPASELEDEMRALHREHVERSRGAVGE